MEKEGQEFDQQEMGENKKNRLRLVEAEARRLGERACRRKTTMGDRTPEAKGREGCLQLPDPFQDCAFPTHLRAEDQRGRALGWPRQELGGAPQGSPGAPAGLSFFFSLPPG